jgi:aryl carrier-like protein
VGSSSSLIEKLARLPRVDRLDELRTVVLTEFRAVLLMTDDEPLAEDENYLSLGVTSRGLMEIKEQLDQRLGADISVNALFNHPTIDRLMAHLTDEVLVDLFARRAERA